MNKKVLIFLILSLCFFATSATATTYYVRSDGEVTCANKATATSPAAASTSLSMAQVNACTFSAGDSVLFSSQGADGGVYSTTLTLPSSGSAGSEITYGNVTNETPTITADATGLIDTNSKNYVNVIGFALNYTGSSSTYGMRIRGTHILIQNVDIDKGGYSYGFVSQDNVSYITIDDCSVTNAALQSIYFFLGVNDHITITDTTTNGSIQIGYSGSTNATSNITIDNVQTAGINLYYVNTGTISDSTSTGSVWVLGDSSYIDYDTVTATNSGGHAFSARGTSHHITYTDCTASNSTSGFTTADTANNLTYTRCTATNNAGNGFSTNGTIHDVLYDRCESSWNGTANVNFDGGGFIPHDSSTGVTARYCIAHDNYNVGFGDVSSGTNTFENSVSWNNGNLVGDVWKSTTVTTLADRGNFYLVKTGGLLTIKNLISGEGGIWEIRIGNASYISLDNNIYYPRDNSRFSSTDGTTPTSWTTYSATNEPNSQNADPVFISTATPDFHLSPTSPAINEGEDLSLTADYDGVSVPQGSAPDIGAYEFILPASPSSLAQYKSNGTTTISSGSYTEETSVVLKFTMSSSNVSDSLTPAVEIQENGTSFTNTATNTGTAVAYSGSPVTGTVTITGLTPGTSYHWQARVTNAAGSGSWVAKGASPDFRIYANDATLSNLSISQGTLSPSFSSGTTSYTASVANSVSSLAVTPTANESNATITVNGTSVTSGSASGDISLSLGENTITIIVTAQDTSTTNTYTITVTRAQPAGGGVPISILQQMNQSQQPKPTFEQMSNPQKIEYLTKQIADLIQQVKEMQISSFSKNLKFGDRDVDVKYLQQYLNAHGFQVALTGAGSPGNETIVFGFATKNALIKFQKANNIIPSMGYFGPKTRAFIMNAEK